MYFCTFKLDENEHIGVLNEEKSKVIPLEKLLDVKFHDMNQFIKEHTKYISKVKEALQKYRDESFDINDVKLCAPIPYPNNDLVCLGKNYIEHALEIKDSIKNTLDIPKFPIYFSKRANPAIGNGDTILSHTDVTDQLDYEVELAVIIGKDGTNIAEEDVEEYIFGYTIVNDISARDIQRKHEQWYRGKSLQTFCPMGPYIVFKSEIPFPVELDISSKVNNELRQNLNTRNMIFNIPHILSELSKGIQLNAGDIIITGTPAGVGLGFSPPKFLRSGDKVECYIEKIGTLVNYIE